MKLLRDIKDWKECINEVICGECLDGLKVIPDCSIDCVVTSPPYWALRDYDVENQLGIESTFQEYLEKLWIIFNEIKRTLKPTGTCWVNLGDTYGGLKIGNTETVKNKNAVTSNFKKDEGIAKCLCQIPSRFAIGMTDMGFLLRNDIIWHKSNAMPSSVLDRMTNKYEHFFFFTKSTKYNFDIDSIRIPYEGIESRPPGIVREREKGYNSKFGSLRRKMEENGRIFQKRRPPENDCLRNPKGKIPGDVWTLNAQPSSYAHIAMFPQKLIAPMICAGCPVDGIVLDPFMGSWTTARAAKDLGRNFIGFELSKEYCKIGEERLRQEVLL
jgi:DNA modification methylase